MTPVVVPGMEAEPFTPAEPGPRVMTCVAVIPDQIQFDCPACGLTHMLTRGLDFGEAPDGTWRLKEQPGYLCDCGSLIAADFKLERAE
jgi:hypothetical protein